MWKIIKIIFLVLIIFIVGLGLYLFTGKGKPAEKLDWGLTFSKRYAIDLDLDWQKTFLSIINDLKVKKIRLIAYWDEIEKVEGEYDFQDLDWQINEVEKNGGEIVLAVGRRLPRWPECFESEWIKEWPEDKKQEQILKFIKEIVSRYKNRNSIKIWQVENEPFLVIFGRCPLLDRKFLQKEIDLVKYLDSSKNSGQERPIMLTESGEFSTWIGAARRADILGTSLYQKVHNKIFGYVKYPIPPSFYIQKSNLIKLLFGVKEIIAVEVQAEPWGDKATTDLTQEEQDITMSFEQFNNMLEYTRQAGFEKGYLWGVEWWYWKAQNGDNRFLDRAKELFKKL